MFISDNVKCQNTTDQGMGLYETVILYCFVLFMVLAPYGEGRIGSYQLLILKRLGQYFNVTSIDLHLCLVLGRPRVRIWSWKSKGLFLAFLSPSRKNVRIL
jgi:hypothetical protein